MARVLKREAAKRDLVAQWVWYAENSEIEVADRFLEAVENTLSVLAAHPQIGSECGLTKTVLRGIRRCPVADGFENMLLFYSPLEDGVDLLRVVHGRRDWERLLAEGSFG